MILHCRSHHISTYITTSVETSLHQYIHHYISRDITTSVQTSLHQYRQRAWVIVSLWFYITDITCTWLCLCFWVLEFMAVTCVGHGQLFAYFICFFLTEWLICDVNNTSLGVFSDIFGHQVLQISLYVSVCVVICFCLCVCVSVIFYCSLWWFVCIFKFVVYCISISNEFLSGFSCNCVIVWHHSSQSDWSLCLFWLVDDFTWVCCSTFW